jgi:hypothetical protein
MIVAAASEAVCARSSRAGGTFYMYRAGQMERLETEPEVRRPGFLSHLYTSYKSLERASSRAYAALSEIDFQAPYRVWQSLLGEREPPPT